MRDGGVPLETALRIVAADTGVEETIRAIYEVPPHPKHTPLGSGKVCESARTFFGYHLLTGVSVSVLKRDPYWKYMEGESDATQKKHTQR